MITGTLRKQGPGEETRGSSNGKDPASTPPKSQFDPGSPRQPETSGFRLCANSDGTRITTQGVSPRS